jgi:hypothetical protein
MADEDVPFGIDRARHQELTGRGWHVWWRRTVLSVFAVLPVLGLLNVFGQHTGPRSVQGPAATLLIDSPAHVRGGLIFTTEIQVTPREPLQDARLYLDNGWFKGMTLNGVSPQPSAQSARGRWQVWDFGQLHAGTRFTVFIAWQANATNPGRHAQDIALYDGSTQLMIVHRTLTVFP